jgi:transposase
MSDSTTSAVERGNVVGDDRLFIGMDVHVRNSYLWVSDAAGKTVKRGRVGNTLGEIAQFLGPLESRPMRVVLESTTNTRAVCDLLHQYARQSGVRLTAEPLNARKLRVIAESVSKCDTQDAAVLSELARSNLKLPACYLPDDEVFALREHLRARADLVRMRTMLKNRLHALLHRRGVLTPPRLDVFTRLGRQWLAELQLDEVGRQILDRQLAVIDELNERVDESTASLRALARSARWSKSQTLLQTIPGVGLITALTILAELGDYGRFKSRAAVSNYAGMVPVVRDSNQKHYGGGITRRGPAALRGTLTEAAWVSVGRVPQYAAIYARVSARSGKQKAIVAVARRMLEDAWTMLKTNQVFRLASAVAASVVTTEAQRIDADGSQAGGGDPSDAG